MKTYHVIFLAIGVFGLLFFMALKYFVPREDPASLRLRLAAEAAINQPPERVLLSDVYAYIDHLREQGKAKSELEWLRRALAVDELNEVRRDRLMDLLISAREFQDAMEIARWLLQHAEDDAIRLHARHVLGELGAEIPADGPEER